MLFHILKQIWTKRRRNGWIFSELLIVFVLSWYIMDYAFVLVHNYSISKGYDVSNAYQIIYDEQVGDNNREEFEQFCNRIKQFQGVKKISLSDRNWGVMPGSGSYRGSSVQIDSASKSCRLQLKPIVSNDYFEIFNINSAITGKTAKLDLSDVNTVILTQSLAKELFGDENPIGRTVLLNGRERRVTDIIVSQKRYPHDLPTSMGYFQTTKSRIANPEIAIMVGDNFSVSQFKKEITSSIKSFEAVEKGLAFLMGVDKEIQTRTGIMIFFLLNVALGVIGTFWFRNQARRGEIGLRMAMGSSRGVLLRQYICEALLLMTLAAIPAICINLGLLQAGVIETEGSGSMAGYITDNKWLRFAITNGITYFMLAVIVTLSAWIPAHRASKVHPVEALRDE